MKFRTLALIALLSTSSYANEKAHEGHEHAQQKQTQEKKNAPKGIFYGKILDIKNAMGYKYLKIKEEEKEIWVAIANAPVKVGDKIGYDKTTLMKNFKSKSLKQEFKEIYFASDVYLPEKDTSSNSLKSLLGLSTPKAKTLTIEEEEKPSKPFEKKEFYTVEEIFMWKKSLKDQTIQLKGTVRKVSKQIMRLDWVHLMDGTGNVQKRTDDLVFTTKISKLKAGDKVTATGKVILNKDFGYGYFYKVIIQESSFK